MSDSAKWKILLYVVGFVLLIAITLYVNGTYLQRP